jgi:hypothetical protein
MSSSWHESYYGKLRKLVGTQKMIGNSIRAIICDQEGRVHQKKRGRGLGHACRCDGIK